MSTLRPPSHSNTTLWTSLIKYYRACLDREQELGVRAPGDRNAQVILHKIDEHLISRKAITTILSDPEHTQPVLAYLNRRGRGIGGTFIYGYPLIRHGDALYPLCYTEVRLEPGTAPQTVVLTRGVSELLFNRQFLRFTAGLTDAEIADLQRALLSPKAKGPVGVIDQYLLEVDLVYDAILFASEAIATSRGPGRELQLMEQLRKDRLPEAIRIFTGEQGIPSARPVDDFLTILPADPGQAEVLRKRRTPFLVATGPAGSGRSQTAINLVATAVAERQKVLYIGRDGVVPAELKESFPGVLQIGGQEAWAESLRHARAVIESVRQPQEPPLDPEALAQESLRLGQEVEGLLSTAEEYRRLEGQIQELAALQEQLERALAHHPHQAWIERHLGRLAAANAALFRPEQLAAIRELLLQVLGWEREGSAGGLWRDMRRSNQIKTALRQAGVPEFCHPEGDLTAQVAELKRLEQAYPFLLARARLLHSQARFGGLRSPETTQARLEEAWRAKSTVDRQRLQAAWQQLADRIRPRCDQLEETVAQEEQGLEGPGGKRAALRRQRFADLLEAFPVIFSPTLAVAGNIPNEPELFDLLILDDASQVDIPSFLPVLYRAKRVCVLGDEHGPRRPTCLGAEEDSRLLGQVEEWNLAPFAYTEISALHRAMAVVGPGQTIQLSRQYRTASALVGWGSRQFYAGTVRAIRPEPGALLLADVTDGQTTYPAPAAVSQAQNPPEAREVARQVTRQIAGGVADLAIITPFRGQALLLQRLLARLGEVEPNPTMAAAIRQVPVLTPEEAANRRFQVVVLSLVAADGATPATLQWLEASRERILQMVACALDRAVLVGHRATLEMAGPTLASLVDQTGAAGSEAGVAPPPQGLQPGRFGLLRGEQGALQAGLAAPGAFPEAFSELEQELFNRLSSMVRGRPVLIAPRLPLIWVLEPTALQALSPEQREAAVSAYLLFTLVEIQSFRPIAAVELEPGGGDIVVRICQQAGLPLLLIRPGQWEGLQAIASRVPVQ